MIISASYRTDIPAFYGRWLLNRLRAGYCKTYNAFTQQALRVPLDPEHVAGFVFWTKNARPFLDGLRTIRAMGYPFVVQYTITGYPDALEPFVAPAERTVDSARRIADAFGPATLVWRYDPVVWSTATPREWHLRQFARIAGQLQGAAEEVIVSFMHPYPKAARRLTQAALRQSLAWSDPDEGTKRAFLQELADLAASHRLRLTVCAQPQWIPPNATPARCIDLQRIATVAGHPVRGETHGNRPGCLCARAVDIGAYDTCPHGCVYCYAVRHPRLAQTRFRQHDPEGEYLFPPGPIRETLPVPQQAHWSF